MDEALAIITQKMDERLESILSSFDSQLQGLKDIGHDIPGFEEWEKTFDEEEWAKENPEDAAMLDNLFKVPDGGYLGDVDLEGMFADKPKLVLEVPQINSEL